MRLVLRWLVTAAALYVTVALLGELGLLVGAGGAEGARPDFQQLLVAAAVLGLVNAFVRPVVLLLTLPLNCLTLGLFTFIVNAALFQLVGNLTGAYRVHLFPGAIVGSLAMGLVSGLANRFILGERE